MAGKGGFSVTISAVDDASARIDAINKRIAAMRAPVDRVSKSLAKFGDTTGITALGRGMRGVAEQSLQAFENVTRLAGPLGAITGAASIAGMVRLTSEWADFGSRLAFTAQRAGMSATQLQALQGAARLAGSSAESLSSGMISLNDNLTKAAAGRSPEAVQAFHYLGISVRDAGGHLRTVSNVLPEVADKIAAIHNPAIQAQLATMLLGGAAEDLLPTLRGGSAAIVENTEKAIRYGVVNQRGIEAANNLRVAQTELSLATRGLGNSVAEALAPALTPMLHDLAEWIAANRDLISQDVAETVKEISAAVISLAHGSNAVAQSIGGWKTVGEIVLAWYAGTFILRMIAGLIRIGATAATVARAIAAVGGGGGAAAASGAGAALPAAGAAAGLGRVAGGLAERLLGGAGVGLAFDVAKDPRIVARMNALESRTFGPRATAPTVSANGIPPVGPTFGPSNLDAAGRASQLLRRFEGFTPTAAWDVNAFRAGYGSDTITDPATGAVSRVTAQSTVTRAQAEADLNRRVSNEFMPAAAASIGAGAWSNLTASEKAAITSVAYNYGHVPASVIAAARTANAASIGASISGLASDNGGINAGRRAAEARIATAPETPGIGAGTGASPSVAEAKLTGGAQLNVSVTGPPGTKISASTTGNAFQGAPRVETAMPMGG